MGDVQCWRGCIGANPAAICSQCCRVHKRDLAAHNLYVEKLKLVKPADGASGVPESLFYNPLTRTKHSLRLKRGLSAYMLSNTFSQPYHDIN
jgi:hypothetical protein